MPQTSVASRMTIAVEGLLADNTDTKDCLTGTSEESSAELVFGKFVKQGTADDGVLAPTTVATDKLKGIIVFGHAFAKPQQLGDTGLKPKTTFSVLNKGRIYVKPEDAVTPASGVFVRCVVAGAEIAGSLRGTADSTDCIDISDYAKWITSAGAAGFAVLEIDMTSSRAVDAIA